MGGICRHIDTGKKAIVLGVLRKGITVKVRWIPEGDISDVSVSSLQPLEMVPFDATRLTGTFVRIFAFI